MDLTLGVVNFTLCQVGQTPVFIWDMEQQLSFQLVTVTIGQPHLALSSVTNCVHHPDHNKSPWSCNFTKDHHGRCSNYISRLPGDCDCYCYLGLNVLKGQGLSIRTCPPLSCGYSWKQPNLVTRKSPSLCQTWTPSMHLPSLMMGSCLCAVVSPKFHASQQLNSCLGANGIKLWNLNSHHEIPSSLPCDGCTTVTCLAWINTKCSVVEMLCYDTGLGYLILLCPNPVDVSESIHNQHNYSLWNWSATGNFVQGDFVQTSKSPALLGMEDHGLP